LVEGMKLEAAYDIARKYRHEIKEWLDEYRLESWLRAAEKP
jgi:hypothetical protein